MKYGINYDNLGDKVYKKKFKLAEVSHKLVKVAFDVVRFSDDDNFNHLWQVQNTDDGDYIVAMYDTTVDESKTVTAGKNPWKVEISKITKDIDVFYKGEHLVNVSPSKIGIPKDEVEMVKKYLPKKLNEDEKFVKKIIKSIKKDKQKTLKNKFPELFGAE
jgi:hypothetical protein